MSPLPLTRSDAVEQYAARWQLHLEPLRITLETHNAVALFSDTLHIDGILAYAVVQQATAGLGLAASVVPYHLPLPLACVWRDERYGLPLWACTDLAPEGVQYASAATFSKPNALHPDAMQRSRDGRPHAPNRTKGPDKAMQVTLPTMHADRFVCDLIGDKTVIGALLADLAHIGKKRTQGYGTVKRWLIESIPAFSWTDSGQRLRRPMPVALLQRHGWELTSDYQYLAWTPPYWHGVCADLCAPAGSGVESGYLPGTEMRAV